METSSGLGLCPRCGDSRLNTYFAENSGDKLGVLCQTCNFKAYFLGRNLIPINS